MSDSSVALVGFLSDFGDENILWPLMALISSVLLLQARYRTLLCYFSAVLLVFGGILTLKLWLEACGRLEGQSLYSPSGHTAGTTFVYGSALLLFSRWPRLCLVAACGIALSAGAGRMILHVHSASEVLVGGGLGFLGVLLLAPARYREMKQASGLKCSRGLVVVLLVGGLVLALSLHGLRSPVEAWLEYFSHRFVAPFMRCPVTPPVF